MKKDDIKVSVVTVTFNQEKYIRQTIESIVSQKTSFNIELIIADDASSDDTRKIVSELAAKYPKIIKPVLRKTNIGVSKNFIETMKMASGEYLALCEGDDYWSDENKLQIQSDFMDVNSDYALCFHPVEVFFETGHKKSYTFPDSSGPFTLEALVSSNYIQTNSVMYRTQNYEDLDDDMLPVDWYLHLYHASCGKIGFINKNMAKYRRHSGGVWWDSTEDLEKQTRTYGKKQLNLYSSLFALFKDKQALSKTIVRHASKVMDNLIAVDESLATDFINETTIKHSNLIIELMKLQYSEIKKIELQMQNQVLEITELKDAKANSSKNQDELQEEYKRILQKEQDMVMSLSWRITKPLRVLNRLILKDRFNKK